jgi:hypothetical protein
MSKQQLVMLLVLYMVATVGGYLGYTMISGRGGVQMTQSQTDQKTPDAQNSETTLLKIDPSEPKDQVCPLNGALYTAKEKAAWDKRRPLAVMIENTPDARPQSGLIRADVVFEVMAEGGVTRFMGMYYCDAQRDDITLAPIRSAREVFFNLASGFNRPLYTHVGGANTPGPADALGQIADAGWNGQNDLNQFSLGYPTFVRDYNRLGDGKEIATEHTMVTSTEKLWAVATKRGWTNMSPSTTKVVKGVKTTLPGTEWSAGYVPWNFQDGSAASAPTTKSIAFEFWDGYKEYGVQWEYDAATNSYKRNLAGAPHIDLETQKHISVKNAVVLFAEEKGPIDEKKHMLYTLSGATGDALVFQNGVVVKAKWSKKDRQSQILFSDEKASRWHLFVGQFGCQWWPKKPRLATNLECPLYVTFLIGN